MTPITETLRRLAEKATPGMRDVSDFEPIVMIGDDDIANCATGGDNEQSYADAAFIAHCYPQTILAMCDAVDAAKAVDACWGVGTKDRDKLIEHLCHYIAEMHTALEALAKVEG